MEGSTITSERDPKVRIQLPKSAQYVGADRWVLYSIADCELHAFVDADRQNNVQRLCWVQFEGYVPTKPELKHKYDSPLHAKISGMDFYVDTWVRANDAEIQPGSDREHIEALVRAKGYKMPAGMMYVRLVHLLDEQKRKELMIIYGEDVASTGVTAAELHEGGKAYETWLVEGPKRRSYLRKLANHGGHVGRHRFGIEGWWRNGRCLRLRALASRAIYNPLGKLVRIAWALSFADCHLVAGLSIPSYTAAAMKWGFTRRQGITILVIATVALIVLIILVVRATSVR